mgnify:CR=1 FL=1
MGLDMSRKAHCRSMKGDKDNLKKIPKMNQRWANFHSRNGFVGSKRDWKEWKYQKAIMNQLINSKGAICGICGKSIGNMKHCTVDHIIPISKGGQTTLENCQLAHVWCNRKKGNKIYKSKKTPTL